VKQNGVQVEDNNDDEPGLFTDESMSISPFPFEVEDDEVGCSLMDLPEVLLSLPVDSA
jgi:hypothetical protein